MNRILVLIGLLFLGSSCWADAGNHSRFHKLATALQSEGQPLVGTFGQSALSILMEVYLAEADLARREQREKGGDAKLASWAAAVEQYSNQLHRMIEQISAGSTVDIRSTNRDMTAVAVAGRSVILSHPRADQQRAFEYRIVADFCAQNSCETLLLQPRAMAAVPVLPPVMTPSWSFAKAGPVCSSRSIQIIFGSIKALPNYRELCRQLLQEVSSLATEIRWQRSQGVKTDWTSIAIRKTPHSPEHIVALTRTGDVTLLPLPLLYSSDGLLLELMPWLRAQVSNKELPDVVLNAQHYGWN